MKQLMHLKTPGNWLNDPNGFIYYKGKYHLFYQHNPNAPVWDTMHWGHAVSPDLVNWEHVGIALRPSIWEDEDGCFSGSAVEHDGKMHLFYTGIRRPDKENIPLVESAQIHIESGDGFTFDNETGKTVIIPMITDLSLGDPADTRDPKVWKENGHWNMILGTTDRKNGKLLFYRSYDLEKWSLVRSLKGPENLGWMWECPDIFETGGSHVLMISPMLLLKDGLREPNQAVCMLVDFEEADCNVTFPEHYQLMDYGLDLYAPQSTMDKEGRRVIVAWLRMPEAVDGKWNGMMCLPRVVETRDGHIYFRIHPEVRSAFSRRIKSPQEAGEGGYLLKLSLCEGEEISVGGYRVRRENGRILADRTQVYPALPDARLHLQTPEIKEGELLEIIVDPNLIEIYINDGEYVLSSCVYGLENDLLIPEGKEAELFTTEN